jgi:deoxyribonuclease V
MEHRSLHGWDVTPQQAVEIQQRLRSRLIADGDDGRRSFRTVAAMDVSYDRRSPWLFAAIVVMRLPEFAVLETASVRTRAQFPYVPGLLSFREAPAGLQVWEQLQTRPDCLICDGHGYAHPRRFGLACHFGVLVDLPTIGFAKRVLVGEFAPPRRERGSMTELIDGGEVIGAALRTREGAAPVFVSVGHRISLARAAATILACSARYRIPEPSRRAHALVNRLREANSDPAGPGSPPDR